MPRVLRWVVAWLTAEIVAFIAVGAWLGWAWVFLAVIVSGFVGLLLIRSAGGKAVRAVADPAARGSVVAQAGWRFVAGVAIAIPGFLSDIVGLVLLIPVVQARLGRRILESPVVQPWAQARFRSTMYADGDVVIGQVIDDERTATDGGSASTSRVIRGQILGPSAPESQRPQE